MYFVYARNWREFLRRPSASCCMLKLNVWGGWVHHREKETKRKRERVTAWGTLKKAEKGERDHLLLLISLPESTPGALCFSTERQDNKWERLSMGEKELIPHWYCNFSIYCNTVGIMIQYCTRYSDVLIHIHLTAVNIPEGDMSKAITVWVKRDMNYKTWHPAFPHLTCPLSTHLFIFCHFITPLSIYLWWEKTQIQRTVVELFFSFFWSTCKNMSWSENERKSGFKVWWYSSEAKCISVSHAPLPLRGRKCVKQNKNQRCWPYSVPVTDCYWLNSFSFFSLAVKQSVPQGTKNVN